MCFNKEYTTALYLQIKKCQFSMRGSDNSIIHTEVLVCIVFLLTCIFWKANSQGTLCYFVLKQILFIQKQDYRCINKPLAITDGIEQLHRFNHPIHFFIFCQN